MFKIKNSTFKRLKYADKYEDRETEGFYTCHRGDMVVAVLSYRWHSRTILHDTSCCRNVCTTYVYHEQKFKDLASSGASYMLHVIPGSASFIICFLHLHRVPVGVT